MLRTRTSVICPSRIAMKSRANPCSVHPGEQITERHCMVNRHIDRDYGRMAPGHPAFPGLFQLTCQVWSPFYEVRSQRVKGQEDPAESSPI